MRTRLKSLNDALRHDPHVILAGDLELLCCPQYIIRLLPRRVQQHDTRLAVDQVHQILGLGPQHRVQQREFESLLGLADTLAHRLDEVVMAGDLGRDDAELVPLVALEDAEHGGCLVLDRRGQLQVQATLRRALIVNVGIAGGLNGFGLCTRPAFVCHLVFCLLID